MPLLSKKGGYGKFIGFMTILLLLSSCKTQQKIVDQPIATTSKIESKRDFHEALASHNLSFDWFTAKADIKTDGQYIDVGGKAIIKICRDSICWMSLRKIGFEGFRVFAEKNQYTVLNRLEGEYLKGDLSDIRQYSGIALDFEELQEVMAGNIFYPKKTNDIIDFICQDDTCTAKAKIKGIEIKYTLDKSNGQIMKLQFEDNYGRPSTITYSDYDLIIKDQIGQHKFPYLITILAFPGTIDESLIEIEFKRVVINTPPKSISTYIPKRYTKG